MTITSFLGIRPLQQRHRHPTSRYTDFCRILTERCFKPGHLQPRVGYPNHNLQRRICRAWTRRHTSRFSQSLLGRDGRKTLVQGVNRVTNECLSQTLADIALGHSCYCGSVESRSSCSIASAASFCRVKHLNVDLSDLSTAVSDISIYYLTFNRALELHGTDPSVEDERYLYEADWDTTHDIRTGGGYVHKGVYIGPFELRKKVEAEITYYKTHPLPAPPAVPIPSMKRYGADLAAKLMQNPYMWILWVIEVFRQLRLDAASQGDLINGLISAISARQAEILVLTTAGHAVLRCCFNTKLPADVPPSTVFANLHKKIGSALQQPLTGTAYYSLEERLPKTQESMVEPPLTDTLMRDPNAKLPPEGQRVFAMAFGCWLNVGYVAYSYPGGRSNWYGPGGITGTGTLKPKEYFKYATENGLIQGPSGANSEQFSSRVKFALAIASHEGNLDAIRLGDDGDPLGFQQWSFHVNEEGTTVLNRLQVKDSYLFDAFFGAFGIAVKLCDRAGRISGAGALVEEHNPDAFSGGVAKSSEHIR